MRKYRCDKLSGRKEIFTGAQQNDGIDTIILLCISSIRKALYNF
ncbi:MAG: hypothetical protein Q4F83_10675 [Eubacteriales bacterium]|nr:hypothetical protein [Eubacteriales bacterium]